MATTVHADRIKAALKLLDWKKLVASRVGGGECDLTYAELCELDDLIKTLDAEIDAALNGGP